MRSPNAAPVADINVTPLIDVMLVLLIIFMVVTPLAHRTMDASMPPAPETPPDSPPPPPALVLEVRTGGCWVAGQPVPTLALVEERLRDVLAVRRDKTVFVRGEGAVPYGTLVAALDAARGAGAERLGLLTTSLPTR